MVNNILYFSTGIKNGNTCIFHNTTEKTGGHGGHRALRTCQTYWNPQVCNISMYYSSIYICLLMCANGDKT